MTTYSITPINCGVLHGSEHGSLTLARHVGEKISVPCILWLVQGGGETIVVDSGPGDLATVALLAARPMERKQGVLQALAEHGVDPADIATLVLTHLHWDHSGGLDLFPNAEILVQRAELQWAIAPLPAHAGFYEWLRPDGQLPRWLEARRRMTILDGDTRLREGIELVMLPGHSPGLMGLRVDTDRGRFLIASDAVPTDENHEQGIGPGWYVDLADVHRTRLRILEWGDTVLPSHDLRVLERGRVPHPAPASDDPVQPEGGPSTCT